MGEATWNALFRHFAMAEYFLQQDTVRAQSQQRAVAAMAPMDGTGDRSFSNTPRIGQFPGYDVKIGQTDKGEERMV